MIERRLAQTLHRDNLQKAAIKMLKNYIAKNQNKLKGFGEIQYIY